MTISWTARIIALLLASTAALRQQLAAYLRGKTRPHLTLDEVGRLGVASPGGRHLLRQASATPRHATLLAICGIRTWHAAR